MLKNIWEIENNPIFSSGVSVSDGKEQTNVSNGVIKQLNNESLKSSKINIQRIAY